MRNAGIYCILGELEVELEERKRRTRGGEKDRKRHERKFTIIRENRIRLNGLPSNGNGELREPKGERERGG
jgi:hypothetical protein